MYLSVMIQPMDVAKLKQIFKEVKNKNSSGTDDITIKIFENLNYGILEVLSQDVTFRSCIKTAVAISLHISGSYDDTAYIIIANAF